MKVSSVTVKLQLPYMGGIDGNWQPDERQCDVAWETYGGLGRSTLSLATSFLRLT
jgi:hypothetical protein